MECHLNSKPMYAVSIAVAIIAGCMDTGGVDEADDTVWNEQSPAGSASGWAGLLLIGRRQTKEQS